MAKLEYVMRMDKDDAQLPCSHPPTSSDLRALQGSDLMANVLKFIVSRLLIRRLTVARVTPILVAFCGRHGAYSAFTAVALAVKSMWWAGSWRGGPGRGEAGRGDVNVDSG